MKFNCSEMSQTGCRNDAKTFCRDDIRPPISGCTSSIWHSDQSPNLSACRKVCIVRLSGINIASSGFALWSVFVSDEKLHHLL